MWRDIPRSGTVFPVRRARRQGLLVGDGESQSRTRCAAAGGKIEQPIQEVDACWGRSSGRRGGITCEGDVLAHSVAATCAAAGEAGGNAATTRGGGSGVAGSDHRCRQGGDVKRTAHAADREGGGGGSAVATGSSLLQRYRVAIGYRASS
ncbi:MAG: hypothetical protein M3P47_02135 [Pseudomonadota bacterium]|nr:hypothetical protein [Pseudomonadota bacterium]